MAEKSWPLQDSLWPPLAKNPGFAYGYDYFTFCLLISNIDSYIYVRNLLKLFLRNDLIHLNLVNIF